MDSLTIKEKLRNYIDNGDAKLLNILYAVAVEYTNEDDYVFTDEDIAELDRRRQSLLNGTSKTYTWEEAKKIITGK